MQIAMSRTLGVGIFQNRIFRFTVSVFWNSRMSRSTPPVPRRPSFRRVRNLLGTRNDVLGQEAAWLVRFRVRSLLRELLDFGDLVPVIGSVLITLFGHGIVQPALQIFESVIEQVLFQGLVRNFSPVPAAGMEL